jgi:YggT family protein
MTARIGEDAGVPALAALLADAVDSVFRFVQAFVYVYVLLILAYILTSWIRLPYSPWLNRVQRFLYDVCEPYLRIFRRVIPTLGPLDLSPMVAVIALMVALSLLRQVFERL